jgi:hypothetical protein
MPAIVNGFVRDDKIQAGKFYCRNNKNFRGFLRILRELYMVSVLCRMNQFYSREKARLTKSNAPF